MTPLAEEDQSLHDERTDRYTRIDHLINKTQVDKIKSDFNKDIAHLLEEFKFFSTVAETQSTLTEA